MSGLTQQTLDDASQIGKAIRMDKSEITDGIQEFCLDSWHEFFEVSTKVFSCAPAFVYRGQADYSWPLTSTLARLQRKYSTRQNLCGGCSKEFKRPALTVGQHLTAFKNAIRGRRGPNAPRLSDDEYWTLGQHHGLATPLLDWTRSPFVALFFAFEEESSHIATQQSSNLDFRGVYALSTSTIDWAHDGGPKGLQLLSTAAESNSRLINQAGLLIRVPAQWDVEKYVRHYFKGETHSATFSKIRIPNKDRHECLVALNKMNINRMTLFPDIDGAAHYVNSIWQPGHEDIIAYI